MFFELLLFIGKHLPSLTPSPEFDVGFRLSFNLSSSNPEFGVCIAQPSECTLSTIYQDLYW
jgi:hypothetical protein